MRSFGEAISGEAAHEIGAVARDESHSSGLLVGVDDTQQSHQLVGLHRGADLDADRVAQASEEPARRSSQLQAGSREQMYVLDVSAVQSASTIANPLQVRIVSFGSAEHRSGGRSLTMKCLWRSFEVSSDQCIQRARQLTRWCSSSLPFHRLMSARKQE